MKVLSTQCKLYPVNRPKCVFYRDLTGTRLNCGMGEDLIQIRVIQIHFYITLFYVVTFK